MATQQTSNAPLNDVLRRHRFGKCDYVPRMHGPNVGMSRLGKITARLAAAFTGTCKRELFDLPLVAEAARNFRSGIDNPAW